MKFFRIGDDQKPPVSCGGGWHEGDDPARQRLGRTLRRPTLRTSSRVVTVSTEVFSSGNCSAKQGFAIAKRLRNWSFARKFPVVEQPKCGAKNIPRIFRRGQTSSGLPPVDSSFGSIWKLFQIDPLRHHGDHPPWIFNYSYKICLTTSTDTKSLS